MATQVLVLVGTRKGVFVMERAPARASRYTNVPTIRLRPLNLSEVHAARTTKAPSLSGSLNSAAVYSPAIGAGTAWVRTFLP